MSKKKLTSNIIRTVELCLRMSEDEFKMKKSEIIKKVAPCSLMCHTCSAYNDGIICISAVAGRKSTN